MLIEKVYKKLNLEWGIDGVGYWDIVKAFSFKYIIKKNPPVAMTSEDWDIHDNFMKTNYPIHVWMFDTMPMFMWKVFVSPFDKLSEFIYYFRHDWNRTIRIKTLNKGWNDCHNILEHGMFAVLNEFVERECASMKSADPTRYNLRQLPFARYILAPYRSRKDGLAHIEEMISGGSSIEGLDQDKTYAEIRDIYLWWNDLRPVRPDPYDISGWSAYCANVNRDKKEGESILNKLLEIEKQYKDEDESMMIRLIKIRQNLWT